MNKKILASVLIFFVSFVISEIIFRILLFSNYDFMKEFQIARLYADYHSDENHWFINSELDKRHLPPELPHPLLGWIGDFDKSTLIHNQTKNLNNRRAVLLYGDSFAAGRARPLFQEIINNDSEINKNCYLLNYGVGGYGIDQSYLLMKNSLKHFNNPIVIFSALTEDIDRNILGFRTGQKPKFELINNKLTLTNTPIIDAEAYIKKHKPYFYSYLIGLALHGNVLPAKLQNYLTDFENKKSKKLF